MNPSLVIVSQLIFFIRLPSEFLPVSWPLTHGCAFAMARPWSVALGRALDSGQILEKLVTCILSTKLYSLNLLRVCTLYLCLVHCLQPCIYRKIPRLYWSWSHRIQRDLNPPPFDREANALLSELPYFGFTVYFFLCIIFFLPIIIKKSFLSNMFLFRETIQVEIETEIEIAKETKSLRESVVHSSSGSTLDSGQ